VKLGILVSPRTVRAYWPRESDPRSGRRTSSQHWQTFVRNHAQGIVAADFLVAITAGFRVLYVFVVMEVGSRRILHCKVTAHPTAGWTLQQFREAIPRDHGYRFLIHDRDTIFSEEVDDELGAFGLKVLRTPRTGAEGQRLLRTADGNDPPGMPGLRDPVEREASADDHAGVGYPLQSGTTPCELGTRSPGFWQ
jgi:hypothetical protein